MSNGKCACGKPLERKTVATKTKKLGKHVLVEAQEAALVCPACGVIAFQPKPAAPMWMGAQGTTSYTANAGGFNA